jgi:hypothetical protein
MKSPDGNLIEIANREKSEYNGRVASFSGNSIATQGT